MLGSNQDLLGSVLADMASCAAYGSLLAGSVHGISESDCNNLLASAGLLGSVSKPAHAVESCALNSGRSSAQSSSQSVSNEVAQVLVFTCQQQRLSDGEASTYHDHVTAALETDEDFFGNFS